MGQGWSVIWDNVAEAIPDPHSSPPAEQDYTEQYSVIATAESVLEFDPNRSYALCVGIDKQLDEKFVGKSLGYIAAKDAISMGEAFVADMGLHRERVNVYTAQDVSFLCKKGALSTLFVNYARKVEEGGIFIFHFSGHGILIKGDSNEWVLAPADFTGDGNTGITADDLMKLIRIADCRARHVLIILDCCYAGGIGRRVESLENIMRVKPAVYVMCACAARETSIALNALGNSIFTFFLLHYFEKYHSKGRLEVKSVMTEVTEMCRSFSSLMLRYTEENGLKSAMMQPQFNVQAVVEKEVVSIDEPDLNRFSFLFSLYDQTLPKPSLHKVAQQWLVSSSVQHAVEMLNSKMPLSLPLQDGSICALMYSMACIHLEYDRQHIVERNFFLTAVISVLSAIGYKIPDVSISLSQLKMALKYYYKPIHTLGIPAEPIVKLWGDMCASEDGMEVRRDDVDASVGMVTGGDEVDASVVQPDLKQVNTLPSVLLEYFSSVYRMYHHCILCDKEALSVVV